MFRVLPLALRGRRQRLVIPLLAATIVAFLLPFGSMTTVLAANRQVTTGGSDSSNCIAAPCHSLAYAIGRAATGDTVTVGAGVFPTNLTITKSVTITGAGAGTTVLDGANAGRVMTIIAGATVAINALTIRHGSPPAGQNGGGILNAGSLTLTNAAVSNNGVVGVQDPYAPIVQGGGIFSDWDSTLILSHTIVSDNTSAGWTDPNTGQSSQGAAGGIFNRGATTINNGSTIARNTAMGGGPGGGIYTDNDNRPAGTSNDSTLTIRDSTLSDNNAGDGSLIFGDGGTITLDSVTVTNNGSQSLSGASVITLQGTFSPVASMTLTGGTFTGNGLGGSEIFACNGGLQFCSVMNSTFTGNHGPSVSMAGGENVIADSTFSNNDGNDGGGQNIFLYGGAAISRVTITNNRIGGIRADGPAGRGITIADSLISGNTASCASGYTCVGGVEDGSFGDSNYGTTFGLTMTNTTVSNNSTTNDPNGNGVGGVSTLNGHFDRVTISGNHGNLAGGLRADSPVVTNSTISGNSGSRAGGIYNDGVSNTTLMNSTISGNSGGAIVQGDQYGYPGTGITVINSTVANNDTGITNRGIDLYNGYVVVNVQNTLLANTGANCTGPITSGGYNLDSGASCAFAVGGTDLINSNPKIGPLGDNGGATATHALLAGSPAIDKIPATGANCPAADQRGIARPFGVACDIGAYELKVDALPVPKPAGPSAPIAPHPAPLPQPAAPVIPGAHPNPLPPHR